LAVQLVRVHPWLLFFRFVYNVKNFLEAISK
jgi:hypothetical protein